MLITLSLSLAVIMCAAQNATIRPVEINHVLPSFEVRHVQPPREIQHLRPPVPTQHIVPTLPPTVNKINISQFLNTIPIHQRTTQGDVDILDLSTINLRLDYANTNITFRTSVGNFDNVNDLHTLLVAILGGTFTHYVQVLQEVLADETLDSVAVGRFTHDQLKKNVPIYIAYLNGMLMSGTLQRMLHANLTVLKTLITSLDTQMGDALPPVLWQSVNKHRLLHHISHARQLHDDFINMPDEDFTSFLVSILRAVDAKDKISIAINHLASFDTEKFIFQFVSHFKYLQDLMLSRDFQDRFSWPLYTQRDISHLLSHAPPQVLGYVIKYIFRYDLDLSARTALEALQQTMLYAEKSETYGFDEDVSSTRVGVLAPLAALQPVIPTAPLSPWRAVSRDSRSPSFEEIEKPKD